MNQDRLNKLALNRIENNVQIELEKDVPTAQNNEGKRNLHIKSNIGMYFAFVNL